MNDNGRMDYTFILTQGAGSAYFHLHHPPSYCPSVYAPRFIWLCQILPHYFPPCMKVLDSEHPFFGINVRGGFF